MRIAAQQEATLHPASILGRFRLTADCPKPRVDWPVQAAAPIHFHRPRRTRWEIGFSTRRPAFRRISATLPGRIRFPFPRRNGRHPARRSGWLQLPVPEIPHQRDSAVCSQPQSGKRPMTGMTTELNVAFGSPRVWRMEPTSSDWLASTLSTEAAGSPLANGG